MNKKDLEQLLNSGFDVEDISFEFDIPIEQVIKCKEGLEAKKRYMTISRTNHQKQAKLIQLRKKYKELYFGDNREEIPKIEPLMDEELELINTVITAITEEIERMPNISEEEKIKAESRIAKELKKITVVQLPLEQAEKLYFLMCSNEVQLKRVTPYGRKNSSMWMQKRRMANQLAQAIEMEQYQVVELEDLKKLYRKITPDLVAQNPILIEPIRTKIANRITAMQQQQAIDRIKNDIPANIVSIIEDLASGNVDIQEANMMINEEAKRRIGSRPKTVFCLTEEQERKQILQQIRVAIRERADKYNIQDPEKVILQLQKLCGEEIGQSINDVVRNLINRKNFQTAKIICNRFSIQNDNPASVAIETIRRLRKEIRNAEIGDIMMKIIRMNGTAEEEQECLELLEQGLEQENIRLSAVPLGKSKDGTRNITLADIWTDAKKNELLK